jgi:hypothetical protein
MPTDLNDLASRVEGATGPNFALETEIAYALGLPLEGLAKPYTASLDAAMTLVPERSWNHMEVYKPDHQALGWTVHLVPDDNLPVGSFYGFAQSYALALAAAALRAHAHIQGSAT